MPISTAHLRAFYGVAMEGGFTKAARVMNVSQSTLSLHVKALEEDYGIQVFDRRGRTISLTQFGKDLLPIAARLFESFDDAEDLLAGAGDLKGGYLLLGATGPHQITPLIAAFNERYPEPGISLNIRNGEKLLEALKERRIDIAVHSNPPREQGFAIIPIRIDPVVVCVAPGHRFDGRESVKLSELKGETLILREKGTYTREITEKAFKKTKFTPKHVMDIDDWDSIRELVASGVGIGIMSALDAGPGARIVKVPLVNPELEIPEYLIFYPEQRRLKTVRAFLDVAREILGEDWYTI